MGRKRKINHEIEKHNKFEVNKEIGSQQPFKNFFPNKVSLSALNEEQKEALRSINENTITFISGPPGTGKTYLAVVYGLQEFLRGKFEKLIFSRPCIEAYGESLGWLPGSYQDKVSPYMIPIFDTLSRFLEQKEIEKYIDDKKIITLPIAYQRGVTFTNSFVLLDEAQNAIPSQVRLFLTRLGNNSKIVVTGDLNQSDIKGINGLQDAINILDDINGIGIIELTTESIVRHPLIKKIEERYSSKK